MCVTQRNGDTGSVVIENAEDCPECSGQVRVTIGRGVLYICKQGGSHGRQLLPALSTALDVPQWKLLTPAWAEQHWANHRKHAAAVARALPPVATVKGYAGALESSGEPYAWLTDERQISPAVLRRYQVGWDSARGVLTFPMFRRGKLVAFKTRVPGAGQQMRAWPGRNRPWWLYPPPRRGEDWCLVVAGELDGLRGRSAGLPAVSVTLGAGTWRGAWTTALAGRLVVVCFDNDEQIQARIRVRELRKAGVQAVRLNLRWLGLDTPRGDLSDYLNGGGNPGALERAARRRHRGRAGAR